MKKKHPGDPAPKKPDLKHDTMEFAASTDGDDRLDFDDPRYEEEDITPEELELLSDHSVDEAFALDAAETDSDAEEVYEKDSEDEDILASDDDTSAGKKRGDKRNGS